MNLKIRENNELKNKRNSYQKMRENISIFKKTQ